MSARASLLLDAIERLTKAVGALQQSLPADAYRVPAAAQRMGVSEAHLRRLVTAGAIRKVPHMGAVVLIAQHEIDRVMRGDVLDG